MKKKELLFAMAAGCLLCSCSSSNESPNSPEVPPTPQEGNVKELNVKMSDNNKAFTNPGMGWNQMYYTFDEVPVPNGDDVNDVLDWLPCDIVSFRLSWNKIESKEGQYNWAIIDDVAKKWTAVGKRLDFKFYTNFLWDHAEKQATPLWVKEAGAKGRYLDHDGKHDNDTWMAAYNDPVLLEKLGNFYKAVSEHYKSSDIEMIELGSIGRVGEGNSYQIGVNATLDEMKTHIDLLRKYFPNTQLIINDDYGSAACSYAKTKGYGVDDHSIGVGRPTNYPGKAYDAEVLDKFKDGTTVIGLEDDTWLLPDEWYYKQMVAACANYCRIHVSPSRLLRDSVKPVVNSMNLKMGYRFQFPEIKLPESLSKGKSFSIHYSIKNVGVGCCTVECHPRFVLKDDNGTEVIGVTDSQLKGKDLMYGKDSLVLDRTVTATLPATVSTSSLTLYVAMVDKDNKPIINLPYSTASTENKKLYKVVQVAVK